MPIDNNNFVYDVSNNSVQFRTSEHITEEYFHDAMRYITQSNTVPNTMYVTPYHYRNIQEILGLRDSPRIVYPYNIQSESAIGYNTLQYSTSYGTINIIPEQLQAYQHEINRVANNIAENQLRMGDDHITLQAGAQLGGLWRNGSIQPVIYDDPFEFTGKQEVKDLRSLYDVSTIRR